ncbi:MAG: hypothetical protein HY331_08770 [Chloroflexi bacterium]|nr:hypothetical protein [Chloroflexota bacterium]
MATGYPTPPEAGDRRGLARIDEGRGLDRRDFARGGAAPVQEAQEPLSTGFRSLGGLLVAAMAVVLLAVPLLWGAGVLLAALGVLGAGVTPPEWDWLLAALFILLTGVVGYLYFALFARDFGGRPTG